MVIGVATTAEGGPAASEGGARSLIKGDPPLLLPTCWPMVMGVAEAGPAASASLGGVKVWTPASEDSRHLV